MRRFARAVILLLCPALAGTGQDNRPIPQREIPKLSAMIDRVRPSVVQILSFYGPGITNQGTGTGFFVSPDGIVVTAKHVISNQPNLPCDTSPVNRGKVPPPTVGPPGQKPAQATKILIELPQVPQHVHGVTIMGDFLGVRARVLACDDKHDIAVLEPEQNPLTMPDKTTQRFVESGDKTIPLQSEKRGPAILSTKAFRDGDPVFTSGYPLTNNTLITTSGYIASSAPVGVDQAGKFEDVYWADIHVNPGNSGGPAFSLETGAVLGMIRAYQLAPVIFDDDHSRAFVPEQRPPNNLVAPKYLDSNSGIAEIIPVEFIERLLREHKINFATR